ncbi:lysine exporter protein [Blastocystis sp. subtype 4]|uniref:lysine exporter protein n=1 Tax=Blastocystis sp. subtype 4 TaxID=944170 RepID=UPI0007119BCF|nr:lysine exporter protein [Blastocystis sp. subtype 4]KNB42167.1 lysine exporter protein [Blastocystis sp. subtype 4]|eukprot:XP_014525610.1 lysine exporter protein [Blastocystis sp. subtype 4]
MSIPVMGPISSLVLRESFSGRYNYAINLAVGASCAEGIYAFSAYVIFFKLVGDSKILDYIMPILKFLAAVIIMNVGRNFTEMTVSTFEPSNESTTIKSSILKGFNASIVNVALVANHIALLTAIMPYHIIEYKKRYSLIWGLGATCGMASWFYILVHVIKAYQKTIKISSVVWVLNNLGSVLILIGIFSLFTIFWNLV